MQAFKQLDRLAFIIFAVSLGIMLITFLIKMSLNSNLKRKVITKKDNRFAILIPARNESSVIEGLIVSITKQTKKVKMQDVYVIVESNDDPTCRICEKYGVNVFVRKKLVLKRKGYALDEVIKDILKKENHYDAYFIFDADNILSPNFIENMNDTFNLGYDAAIGYRNSKNLNDNHISVCSTLIFSIINTIGNKNKVVQGVNALVSGTGFYIKGDIIEKLGGFPFDSLTEDFELSLYLVINGYSCTYNNKAEYFDEQPTSFKSSYYQRLRWVKGFIDVRKKYANKLLYSVFKKDSNNRRSKLAYSFGIMPYLYFIFLSVIYIAANIYISINLSYQIQVNLGVILLRILYIIVFIYLLLFIFTGFVILLEKKKMKFTKKTIIKALFYNPIFLFTFIPIYIKALFTKNIEWVAIEHKKKEIQK